MRTTSELADDTRPSATYWTRSTAIVGRTALRERTTKELDPDAIAFKSGRFGSSSFFGGVGNGFSSGFLGSGKTGGFTGFSFGTGGFSVYGLVYLATHLTGSMDAIVAGSTGSTDFGYGSSTSRTSSTDTFGIRTSLGFCTGRGGTTTLNAGYSGILLLPLVT